MFVPKHPIELFDWQATSYKYGQIVLCWTIWIVILQSRFSCLKTRYMIVRWMVTRYGPASPQTKVSDHRVVFLTYYSGTTWLSLTSQINGSLAVCSTSLSGRQQRKHQIFSHHRRSKKPVMRKEFTCHGVRIMFLHIVCWSCLNYKSYAADCLLCTCIFLHIKTSLCLVSQQLCL